MKQYLDLLQNIVNNGVEKESGRPNMPHTWGIEDGDIKMDLRNGFPLLTTKKMYWKGIVHELLWFLHGETNIKYLVDNSTNIWNDDAYRWYQKFAADNGGIEQSCIMWNNGDGSESMYSKEQFVAQIKNTPADKLPVYKFNEFNAKRHGISEYRLGDLGKVYGYQWRNQNGVDQVKDVIDGLKNNPYSRYHIIDGWNKADFRDMALPPCHLLYQFIVRPLTIWEREKYALEKNLPSIEDYIRKVGFEQGKQYEARVLDENNIPKFYLNLNMYQRSCDTFLGVPFNLASMSLLLMIVAKACNMIPKQAKWSGGDVHIYMDHIPVVKEQISRTPKALPKMIIKKELNSLEDILALTINDFELQNYESDDKLFGELHTGYTK